ncbi:putative signal transducing protein [Thermomonas sp.]
MRIVYQAANLMDAHLVRHALEWADIPAFVRGEALVGGIGELPAFGLVSVAVPDSAWEQALAIVDQLGFGSNATAERDGIPSQGGACPA